MRETIRDVYKRQHVYMLMDAGSRCNVKEDVMDAVEEIKKAAEKLTS